MPQARGRGMNRDNYPGSNVLDGLVTKPLQVISHPRESDDSLPSAEFRDVKEIASYSWIDDDEPTIAVPGAVYLLALLCFDSSTLTDDT